MPKPRRLTQSLYGTYEYQLSLGSGYGYIDSIPASQIVSALVYVIAADHGEKNNVGISTLELVNSNKLIRGVCKYVHILRFSSYLRAYFNTINMFEGDLLPMLLQLEELIAIRGQNCYSRFFKG